MKRQLATKSIGDLCLTQTFGHFVEADIPGVRLTPRVNALVIFEDNRRVT